MYHVPTWKCDICGEDCSRDEISFYDCNGEPSSPEERYAQDPDHVVRKICHICEEEEI